MQSIYSTPYIIPAADLNGENPLPMFRSPLHDRKIDYKAGSFPEEDKIGFGWETGFRVLPYRMQDKYSRELRPREFSSIILENEFLKVRVLPEVGGLVTSILHKAKDRELLHCNPAFQPGNLALRNAWVSGGIEWNTAQLGHHYLTCSPIHTAIVKGNNGENFLRLYAWERVKCFPYQIDLHLPAGSAFLYVYVRIINPHDYEIPMYWWTNMGVPEYPEGRVLSPADTCYHAGYVDCPVINDIDHSYATRLQSAYDIFFRIPQENRKWQAIVDKNGVGMIHTSTKRLKGRKMFVWGMGPGSRRWNEYLSGHNNPFQEIQAGLGYTQSHSLPMPAKATWDWAEAIGYFESEPSIIHSTNWKNAYMEAETILEKMLPEKKVEDFYHYAQQTADVIPSKILFKGLGWGALENIRAEYAKQEKVIPESMPFAKTDLSDEQHNWLHLLEKGFLPELSPDSDPGQYMIQPEWYKMLEQSINSPNGNHWFSWYHLGVIRMENEDIKGAEQAWKKSIELRENCWSYRNLSVIAQREEKHEEVCTLLLKAWNVCPKYSDIAIEYINAINKLNRYNDVIEFVENLSDDMSEIERIKLEYARAAVKTNKFEIVERILNDDFATIREGELSLSELWFEMKARQIAIEENIEFNEELLEKVKIEYLPDQKIDFRMFLSKKEEYIAPQDGI